MMMFEFKAQRSRSWFDCVYGKVVAAELGERLANRARGERGRFITLTYRHEGWIDARECFRASQAGRHVRKFMERLGRYVGENLRGRWLCKLEFQSNGWAHFHILVLGIDWIETRGGELYELWGYGAAHVAPATEESIRYICKYIAKGGHIPPWVDLEPIRSIKVIRVSPGFWRDSDLSDHHKATYHSMQLSAYVPIGVMRARSGERVVCRLGRNDAYRSRDVSPMEFLEAIYRYGGQVAPGGAMGWIRVVGVEIDADLGAKLGDAPADAAQPPAGALYLSQGANPPDEGNMPIWLHDYFEWLFGWNDHFFTEIVVGSPGEVDITAYGGSTSAPTSSLGRPQGQ